MSKEESREQEFPVPTDVQGFERLHLLLRGLAAVQEESSFYERIQVLLLLSRWTGAPLTLRDMSRHLRLSLEKVSLHLPRLRACGWLINEDRTYSLTTPGRLLIFVLRILAQPWEDGDSVAVITQLYQAASSQELGIGSELLFEDVVATIEASLRRLRKAVSAERASLVSQYHEESSRNIRMADMALTLRQQAGGAQDYESAERMHHAISVLSALSGQFEQQHLSLLERDLLTSGQVTLGDLQTWIAQASDVECTSIIAPSLEQTIPQPWHIHEGKLIAAEADISGRPQATTYRQAPPPQSFGSVEDEVLLDSHQQYLAILQGRLRQRVHHTHSLPLALWINHPLWRETLALMMVALDPLLQTGQEPVSLLLDPAGSLVMLEQGAAKMVSEGMLSRKQD